MSNGRTSRLYRALVRDKQIASDSAGFTGLPGNKYPHLFAFYAVPLPGHTTQEVGDAIHAEIERVKKEDISDEELKMIKTRAKANLIRSLGSNEGLAVRAREQIRRGMTIGESCSAPLTASRKSPRPTCGGWRTRSSCPITARSGSSSSLDLRLACRGSARRWTMKRVLFSFLIALLIAAPFSGVATRWAQTSWKQIPIPKLPPFKPAQPKRIELPNGMVIFLQEDHELPLIDGTARIRGGEHDVPAAKTRAHGYLWRGLAHGRHQDANWRPARRLS